MKYFTALKMSRGNLHDRVRGVSVRAVSVIYLQLASWRAQNKWKKGGKGKRTDGWAETRWSFPAGRVSL